jgi:tRNA(adenine34) deaminase
MKNHQFFMSEALKEAKIAFSKQEVPVGAVLVRNNEIILRAHNTTEEHHSVLQHAEISIIQQYAAVYQEKYLHNCTLYVTLEPCIMCTGALLWAKLPFLVFGALDPKIGACGSKFNLTSLEKSNHQTEVISGIEERECENLLKNFFTQKRAKIV